MFVQLIIADPLLRVLLGSLSVSVFASALPCPECMCAWTFWMLILCRNHVMRYTYGGDEKFVWVVVLGGWLLDVFVYGGWETMDIHLFIAISKLTNIKSKDLFHPP